MARRLFLLYLSITLGPLVLAMIAFAVRDALARQARSALPAVDTSREDESFSETPGGGEKVAAAPSL